MLTTDAGMRIMGKIRDIVARDTGERCWIGLLAREFAAGSLQTIEDAKGKEATYPGYARQELDSASWSAPTISEGKPSLVGALSVWTFDETASGSGDGGAPNGPSGSVVALIDGDADETFGLIRGWFLALKAPGGTWTLFDAVAFSAPVALDADNPVMQFAPVLSFVRSLP